MIRRIVLVLCAGVLLAGCAAKSAPPAAPASMAPTGGDAAPGSGLELQEESDDDGDAASSPPSGEQPSDTTASTTTRDRSSVASAMAALEEDEVLLNEMFRGRETALSDKSGCARACDALRSMKRSVDAICDLAGSDDERCSGAQQRLDKGRARVEGASCGCE